MGVIPRHHIRSHSHDFRERNLKKSRGDVLLQLNAMVAEFAHKPDEERFRAVIHGKSFEWWRKHLITALEFFDRMRDRTLNMGG